MTNHDRALADAREVLKEAQLITGEPYGPTLEGMTDCIRDLLDIIDQKDGDITAIEDEFNDYKEFVEDNYRHRTPREDGWE